MRFNVGDEVILNDLADRSYAITKSGSRGVVELVYGSGILAIRFTHTTGRSNDIGLFTIHEECVELVSSADSSSYKFSQVIRKIKQMDERRKGLGYAF